eukprot:5387452-Pyramimonas_sp.AAC.1
MATDSDGTAETALMATASLDNRPGEVQAPKWPPGGTSRSSAGTRPTTSCSRRATLGTSQSGSRSSGACPTSSGPPSCTQKTCLGFQRTATGTQIRPTGSQTRSPETLRASSGTSRVVTRAPRGGSESAGQPVESRDLDNDKINTRFQTDSEKEQ